jgi:lysozyme family protein
MSAFDNSLIKTLKYEGGYVNDPSDAGGETYKGISRKNWPGWSGWKIIDSYKTKSNFSKLLLSDTNLDKSVSDFYYNNFWKYIGGDKLKNEKIAFVIFDTAVNNGINTAIKLVQETVYMSKTGILTQELIDELNRIK